MQSSKHLHGHTIIAGELKFDRMFTSPHMSHVTHHVSNIMCHESHVEGGGALPMTMFHYKQINKVFEERKSQEDFISESGLESGHQIGELAAGSSPQVVNTAVRLQPLKNVTTKSSEKSKYFHKNLQKSLSNDRDK